MLFQRMVIIGPGLIGGSLGLAAKKAGLVGHVVGVGHRQSSLDKAIRMGAIDSGSLAPASALDGADAVVVCTAVGLIPEMIRQVAPGLKPGCIVSDVGSTKSGIVREAEAALPAGVHFVGAHPIAGSERRGVEVATVDLFRGRVCVLTPGAHTDARALAKMKELWAGVGARLFMLSPEEHDVILARTSHLPHAVASALLATLEDKDGPFVGSGFRDTTRIGSGDPDLWADILLSNREAALAALKVFGGKLDELSRALAEGDSAKVRDFLARARDRREEGFSELREHIRKLHEKAQALGEGSFIKIMLVPSPESDQQEKDFSDRKALLVKLLEQKGALDEGDAAKVRDFLAQARG